MGNNLVKINTNRLEIVPLSLDELEILVEKFRFCAVELSQAYEEMLNNCKRFPQQFLWYTAWKFCFNKTEIGYACFKGLNDNGGVEIGYGINEGFEEKCFATEGVEALCSWALKTNFVNYIEAETEPNNFASLKVLTKIGFKATGEFGDEGPKFILIKN